MRTRRRLLYTVELFLLLVLRFCVWAIPAAFAADGPPAAPILRVETGGHTAAVMSIAFDLDGKYMVTGSDDKTVRVWDASTGSALSVLRPPIGDGLEGAIYAVAISPDGSTVVCGGETGYTWDKEHSVYIFDRITGHLVHRIATPSTIHSIAYAPLADFLAVGSDRIRVYRTSDWKLVGEDTDYAGDVYGLSFDNGEPAATLATSSLDGYLRVYKVDDSQSDALHLRNKVKLKDGAEPMSAAISPDGERIAVGYEDTPRVTLFSTSDLSVIKSIDAGSDQADAVQHLAWSDEGDTLFGSGNCFTTDHTFILAWPNYGEGDATRLVTKATMSIMAIAYCSTPRTSGIGYVSADPDVGVVDDSGNMKFDIAPTISHTSSNFSQLQVDADGKQIRFAHSLMSTDSAQFSIVNRAISAPTTDEFTRQIFSVDGVDLNIHYGEDSPATLNNKTLPLDPHERSHGQAFAPDHNGFLIAADSHVYCFNVDGTLKWKQPVAETARCVDVTADGRLAVAAVDDGTIRWYSMDTGNPLLTFFPAVDGKRWIAWTPSGYYDCSPGGDDLIGWHINGASDEAASFYPASRFRSLYYRPDVIQKVLDTADEAEAVKEADDDAGRKKEQADITDRLPPVVTILSPDYGAAVDDTSVTLKYTVRTPSDAPVTSVKYLIDGRPASEDRDLKLVDSSDAQSATITIPEHDCTIGVIAENAYGAGEVASVRVTWNGSSETDVRKPTLYVLAVGVGAYPDPIPSLKFPSKDATEFVAAVKAQKGSLYQDVIVKQIEDKNATRAKILDGFDWIEKEPTQYDVAMVFLSGHGVNDTLGNYYYAGVDIDPDHLRETGVPFSDIKDTIQSLACKTIFFIDTCHSGNALGTARMKSFDINGVVNELSSAENGAVVFASSTGRQVSEESDEWGNGAFTKALVEGLDGKAANGSGGRITWMSLSRYISDRVKQLTDGQQTPTTTTPSTVPDFPVAFVK